MRVRPRVVVVASFPGLVDQVNAFGLGEPLIRERGVLESGISGALDRRACLYLVSTRSDCTRLFAEREAVPRSRIKISVG
jgi:hypothetical protein